jgi:MoaA/NifB/PqqE/SkfB family radical SAM enzyme
MTEVITQKNMVFPEVEERFIDEFPDGFRPWVEGWSFQVDEMMEQLPDGTFRLLTLDISISEDSYVARVNERLEGVDDSEVAAILTERAERFYDCEIGCKHCFECRTKTDNPLMTTDEVFGMLMEAKELGLKTVKFLGPGELLHNPKLFEILDFLKENGIHIGIFTKGLVLGDDEYAKKIFGISAQELCEKLYAYENITILLSFTSATEEIEKSRIDSKKVPDLFYKRNKAVEYLAQAGFGADPEKQRLAFVCTPVLRDNIDEVFEMYKWALKRGIPMVVAPTMVSGKGMDMPEITDPEFKEKQLVDLYVEIYTWLIKERVLSLVQIEAEGIAPYPGFACNQFISGMMIRKDGRAQACPGNEGEGFIYDPDVRKTGLKEIWVKSLGYKLRQELVETGEIKLTQPCYAKSEGILVEKGCGSIPVGFYDKIIAGIRERISQELT